MLSLEKIEATGDSEMLSLAKETKLSLEKHNLSTTVSKVALCLDVSYSMSSLYTSGKISALVKKLIPLGVSFDDDGEIDVFAFGENGHEMESINLDNYQSRLDSLVDIRLEGRTNYEKAISLVEKHYKGEPDVHDVPVYVIFITDGDASDERLATTAIKQISKYPIFFQFIALGAEYEPNNEAKVSPEPVEKKGFFGRLFGGSEDESQTKSPKISQAQRLFPFLLKLDDMPGRTVDNAGFFAVSKPDSKTVPELYDLMMGEYPQFLVDSKKAKTLKR